MQWSLFSTGGRDALSDSARQQLRSYGVIVGIFIFLLALALAASWGAIRVVDATRAYVTGESRYSKAEKIAVLALHRYAFTGRQEDYSQFLAAIRVPQGDHAARAALQQSPPDLAAARRGFVLGENHPDDIFGLIHLFEWFSWWPPFKAAVGDWTQGDALVRQLVAEGSRLHASVLSHSLDEHARMILLQRVDRVDDRLTILENTFSQHLGVAARGATMLVVATLSAMTILLWAMGIAFAARLVRRQLALGTQLGSSEQRFRDYAEVASDWYWETDTENRVTYVSDRFAYVARSASNEALGGDAAAFIRQHALTRAQRELYVDALTSRKPFRGIQIEIRQPSGKSRYWSISGKPRFDANDVYVGYRGVGSDVTEAMRDAEALRSAKIHAETANRAKSEFLANMSHELRTPLNAILGFSDIISRRVLGPDAMDRYSEYASDIHRSGEHLLHIINDILDLSKIEAGRVELEESEVHLGGLAKSLHRLLAHRFEAANLQLEFDMPEPALSIIADETKLSQILINLLSNSLKFTPAGGRVTFSTRRLPDGCVAIAVTDTGIGIAAEDIETVMSPFGQVESAFSRKHHGTGLGLPLAKSLAELHGGTLQLASLPGQGTSATLVLLSTRVVAAGLLPAEIA
ncbi:MAG: ATP-binding protein [Rhizomicrobium sp.]|jgi:PAS domain S-box-containing protein